jgi:hypothetical protein
MHLKDLARHAFNASLDDEAYGQSQDTLVYGNTPGVELVQERDEYRMKVDGLVSAMEDLKTQVKEMKISERELRSSLGLAKDTW